MRIDVEKGEHMIQKEGDAAAANEVTQWSCGGVPTQTSAQTPSSSQGHTH